MYINTDLWCRLSDLMLRITRDFNEEKSWRNWTTSGWRMLSDERLRELLKELHITIKEEK